MTHTGVCGGQGFNPDKTAAHELGHFMNIQLADSDENHPHELAHPHRDEAYETPDAPYGCVMDYKADQGNDYCEFCVHCINTVRTAGTR